MIALDSSALIAIALREPGWDLCFTAINREPDLIISAVTLTETLIVAARRQVPHKMPRYLDALSLTVVPLDRAGSYRAAAAYAQWGKGNHPARLNFVDCFSYDVAKQHDCPLLFIGNDFSQTDIRSALAVD